MCAVERPGGREACDARTHLDSAQGSARASPAAPPQSKGHAASALHGSSSGVDKAAAARTGNANSAPHGISGPAAAANGRSAFAVMMDGAQQASRLLHCRMHLQQSGCAVALRWSWREPAEGAPRTCIYLHLSI